MLLQIIKNEIQEKSFVIYGSDSAFMDYNEVCIYISIQYEPTSEMQKDSSKTACASPVKDAVSREDPE